MFSFFVLPCLFRSLSLVFTSDGVGVTLVPEVFLDFSSRKRSRASREAATTSRESDEEREIVGAAHAHYAWITKTYGLYFSHDALQVPNLLGVIASVCTPLPTRTQQLPTLLHVGSCCARLHAALGIRDMISYKQNWTRISRG